VRNGFQNALINRIIRKLLPSATLIELLLLPLLRIGLILTRQARTLGSVGIVVSTSQVLLVRTWYRADWGLPGGYLRRGEEPVRGLVRELLEETGLEIRHPTEDPMFLFQRHRRHIDFVFTVHLECGPEKLPGGKSSEITMVQWFELDDLPRLQPEADAALRAAGLR